MWLLEIVILFGVAFCFVDSNYETTNFEDPNSEKEECNNELEFDCFCYDGPGDKDEYSICVDKPKILNPCLSNHLGPNYRMVGQRCIYFDKSTSNYAVAREKCKSTFSGRGRMYQPTNFEESTNIAREGQSKFKRNIWWIGVNDIYEEGKFVFDIDRSPITFTPTWYSNINDQRGNAKLDDCVYVYSSFWNAYSCSDSHQIGTLCEYGE